MSLWLILSPACPPGVEAGRGSGRRDGRSFRPGLEPHGAPVTATGTDGDAAAEGDRRGPPRRAAATPPPTLARFSPPAQEGDAAAAGREYSDPPPTRDINRSYHWSALRDVKQPACLFHVIAKGFLNGRGREAGLESVPGG